MKNKILFFSILTIISFLCTKDTYAYDQSNYASRKLCGNFEVASLHDNGNIVTVSCHGTYEEAKNAMKVNGAQDLVIFYSYSGTTKIIDANAALVDLTLQSSTINIYTNSELTGSAHTYINGQSGYGAVDAAYLESAYSSYYNVFVAKIKIGGTVGWISQNYYEIVPLTWVKSSSSYTISNDTIRHNYVSKIQNIYNGSSGTTIGPKPSNISSGVYYSYDGHYFYTNQNIMLQDYKSGHYNNAINRNNPYYNYYQYLPSHTRTTYSSLNVDEYIRNNLGYQRDVYGTTALSKQNINTSRLYGKGTFFYNAQEIYGVNAVLALSLSRNETRNGTSNLAINKNNGFGLNAVDSNPTQASDWYASFASSIYGYASKWVTYGYSKPTDWRYYGNHYGNKDNGMNVKYASDVYWGEKMASNYYFLDKALGLQDYNYYQLGVTNRNAKAMSEPNYTSKNIYNYRSANNAVVILGEIQGQEVDGNTTWYKVISDLNVDDNFNTISSGNYNWNAYAYVPAAHIVKINEGKNGYVSPNDVTEYQDKNYTYDLYIENTLLKPKVAVSVKETSYYYDPMLTSSTGQKLINQRYLMVYTTAYDENKNPIAYLVTSDYKYDQKHWVSANSIKIITCEYGQAHVTVEGVNTYTIVNPTTIDDLSTHISGLYHYAYTPIMEIKVVNGQTWYKVPVNLSGTTNSYGWTLALAPNVGIARYQYVAQNTPPVIQVENKTFAQGEKIDELEGVTATDAEDGNITDKVKVSSSNVKIETPGTYEITYTVTDNNNNTVFKTISVTITGDEEPVIHASNKTITIGTSFDPKLGINITDKEDGTISEFIVDDSKVNYEKVGQYEITYTVKDSFGHVVTKKIILTIQESKNIEEKKEQEGTFYFDYLNKVDNKLQLRGYLTINGMNNTLNEEIVYYVKFIDTDNKNNTYIQQATRITDLAEIDRPIYSADGYEYTHSWFEANIDVENLPIGNYIMIVVAEGIEKYSTALVTNKLYKTEITGFKTEEKTVNIKNNYSNRTSAVTLYVRDKEIPKKTVGSYYNQYDIWREFDFVDNKLHLKGASYSYGMDLSKDTIVSRSIIFENQAAYKIYKYKLSSITNGLYTVALPVSDKLDKTRAWYDATIDISTLPKGKYKIYITTTSNVTDYHEFTDNLGRELTDKKITIGDRIYQFILNKENGNSIELEVS